MGLAAFGPQKLWPIGIQAHYHQIIWQILNDDSLFPYLFHYFACVTNNQVEGSRQ